MEINLVGELPKPNGYSYVLTACDVLPRYLFPVPLRKLDTTSVVRALLHIFIQHTYISKHIITEKGTAFTSQLMIELMQASDTKVDDAILKHAQTMGMVERTHQKLKQILKINVTADTPQKDRFVNIAVMAHITAYHQ